VKVSVKRGLALVLASLALAAQAETLDHLKDLWRAKKYEQVIPLLLAFREQPGGRTWPVDYMIGTSECRVAGRENNGAAVLTYLLSNYRLPDTARSATEHEIEFCRQSGSASHEEPPFFYVPVSGQVASGPMVAGKGGYEVPLTKVTTSKALAIPVPVAELKKRVFPLDQGAAALQSAQKRFPVAGDAAVMNGFVLLCGHYCAVQPKDVGECLVKYEAPLRSEFDIAMPAELVTVYLARDPREVVEDASRLHGINLPLGTVAYSVYEDLSLVGIAGYGSCGSLAHELVHLAIRQNFGDSPAWMEEGLASEVAVASPVNKSFRFGTSWRDDMLRKYWSLRPTVAQLLKMNWTNYAANDMSAVNQVAAVHAMAATFVRYLDAKKKLVPVYFAMRDGRFSPASAKIRSDEEILQQQLGMKVEQIDADFVKWFKASAGGEEPAPVRSGVPQSGNEPAYPMNTVSPNAPGETTPNAPGSATQNVPNAARPPLNQQGPNAPPHPPQERN